MLIWIGHKKGKEGIHGVPARDLSEEEIKIRGLDRKALIKSGLYKIARKKKTKRR